MEAFEKELTHIINRHNIDSMAGMPDFLLARMICRMIEALGPSIEQTLDWHGRSSVYHPSTNAPLERCTVEHTLRGVVGSSGGENAR